jgi:ribosomal protein S14
MKHKKQQKIYLQQNQTAFNEIKVLILKTVTRQRKQSARQKLQTYRKIQKYTTFSSKIFPCLFTGYSKAVFLDFKTSRFHLKKLANDGLFHNFTNAT